MINRTFIAILSLLPVCLTNHRLAARTLEPAEFGAFGDGRPHAIGTAYGASLAALAAHVTSSGTRPYAWVLDPAYGLTFSRVTVSPQAQPATELRFARIAGSVDANAQIILPGMGATASCLPPGVTVRSVAEPGVVTLTRASTAACAAGTRIEFVTSPPQVQALQADWLGIQSAIAAAYALPTGGAVHIPGGNYLVNRPLVTPGGIHDTYDVVPQVDEYGDGLAQTRIAFITDTGPGTCGFGEANRGIGSTTRARIRDLRLIGPDRRRAIGVSPAVMDGFCIGAKELLRRVRADGFHAGVNVLEDHWEIQDSEFPGNLYGIYLAPGGDTFGNGVLRDVFPGGSLLASIAVSAGSVLDSATLQNVHLGFAPYGFYREHAPAGTVALGAFITNSLLQNVWGEDIGNAYIYGENGGSDRVVRNTWIDDSPVMSLNEAYRLPGTPPQAFVHAGSWTGNDMIGSDFGNPNNYRVVARALIEVTDEIQGNAFGRAADMVAGSSAAKPALHANVMIFNTFSTGEAHGRFVTAVSPVHRGEILAEAGGDRVEPFAAGRALAGVAMAAADAGGVVPVCDAGVVLVDKAQPALHPGQLVAAAPNNPTRVSAAPPDRAAFATVWQDAPEDAPTALVLLGPLVR